MDGSYGNLSQDQIRLYERFPLPEELEARATLFGHTRPMRELAFGGFSIAVTPRMAKAFRPTMDPIECSLEILGWRLETTVFLRHIECGKAGFEFCHESTSVLKALKEVVPFLDAGALLAQGGEEVIDPWVEEVVFDADGKEATISYRLGRTKHRLVITEQGFRTWHDVHPGATLGPMRETHRPDRAMLQNSVFILSGILARAPTDLLVKEVLSWATRAFFAAPTSLARLEDAS